MASWLGVGLAGTVIFWAMSQMGGRALVSLHGIVMVLGGSLAALLINSSFSELLSALARLGTVFFPSSMPTAERAIAEIVRLARKARAEGGILALQRESPDFAGGFLNRCLLVAISSGEAAEIRNTMEAEIRQLRLARQEDANLFRTLGTLAPMFGLMGTVVGMIEVLRLLSEPTKLGDAMALALSSALFGIALANFFCIPVAGRIRGLSLSDTLVREVLLEGVLDIFGGAAPYLIELRLAAYSTARRRELAAREAAPAARAVLRA